MQTHPRTAGGAAAALLFFAACSQPFQSTLGREDRDAGVVHDVTSFGGVHANGALADAGTRTPDTRRAASMAASSSDAGLEVEGARAASDGAASDANVDAAPDATAGSTRCSAATAGPRMVTITSPTGSFCIDETEVTISDYAAFLAADPPVSLAPQALCSFKKSFVPDGVFPPADKTGTEPVSLVDWCDAAAYCAFAGKHLCGRTSGGPSPYADFAKPTDEWYFACTAGGATTFPYGSVFDPSACVGVDYDGISGFQPATDAPHPVGSAVRCHASVAPFDALYDLAGNVSEWEDSCDSSVGSADYCHVRGESYREGNASTTACGYAPRATRSYRAGYIGFRCCL